MSGCAFLCSLIYVSLCNNYYYPHAADKIEPKIEPRESKHLYNLTNLCCIVGNFRGVRIFVMFVTHLSITKFSDHKMFMCMCNMQQLIADQFNQGLMLQGLVMNNTTTNIISEALKL